MPNKKLNTREAAEFLGVKPCTLELWRCRKKGPRYSKLGSRVMYDLSELEAWFASQSVHTIDTVPQLSRFINQPVKS